jgi:hypothetical protein
VTERVYLHIGEPKCGTTFLQHVVWSARSELARQGVLLPGLSDDDQFRAAQDLRGARQPEDDPAGSWVGEWEILTRQALGADRSALISHEMLAGATQQQAEHAVRGFGSAEVHIIVTVRDIASLLPAEWQETVKHQNGQTWSRWLSAVIDRSGSRRVTWFWTVHDTVDLLARWAALVPPTRVHVITMPPRGSRPNLLWERFASVIGLDPGSIDTSIARPNSSLGLPEVEMLRQLNRRLRGDLSLPQWFYSARVKEILAQEILAARPKTGARLALPRARAGWAREVAEKQIAGLRDGGYDIVGDLDELLPSAVEGPHAAPKDVTYKQLYDVSMDALANLLQQNYELAVARPSLRSLLSGGATEFPGAYRIRSFLRNLGANHPAVARLRVLLWRLTERTRHRRAKE